MGKSKIETYLGFSIRARKIIFGVDNIESERKGVFLIVVDEKLSLNSLKNVEKAKDKFSCAVLIAKENVLGEMVCRPAVKAVAIKDKNLAEAILVALESEPQFKLYSGGNN
ncbi:MAG: hypothetical protein IJV85_05135 [Clostridia bacterium]|nr:hypothetical protein [Clostridia bacterium]